MSSATVTDVPPPRLRRLPAPVLEPRPALRVVPELRHTPPDGQGRLPLELSDRYPTSGRPPRPPGVGEEAASAPAGAGADAADGLPDPATWAGQFVQAALEVSAGLRPPSQLARRASGDVHATLSRRGALAARIQRSAGVAAPHRAVVRTVVACRPAPDVCEVSAVVADRQRFRAVALRLEAVDGRWRVVAFELG